MILAHATVERHRPPLAQRLPSWALPAAGAVVLALLLVAALVAITERHERRAAERRVCAAQLETFYVRNPLLRAGRVPLADPCVEWRATAP